MPLSDFQLAQPLETFAMPLAICFRNKNRKTSISRIMRNAHETQENELFGAYFPAFTTQENDSFPASSLTAFSTNSDSLPFFSRTSVRTLIVKRSKERFFALCPLSFLGLPPSVMYVPDLMRSAN